VGFITQYYDARSNGDAMYCTTHNGIAQGDVLNMLRTMSDNDLIGERYGSSHNFMELYNGYDGTEQLCCIVTCRLSLPGRSVCV